MFLYNKQKGYVVNVDEIRDIFQGRDQGTVAASLRSGYITKIATYDSDAEAKKAIEILVGQMATSRRSVLVMPEPEAVREKLRNEPTEKMNHITGKKTKGHGGS